ncbi:RNA transcription, translation and transport factor protein [Picochlorum sp. SENEW3]|nr:RNA transcription, translation and transport factor protein [Picochlorum sp. SENEW3]WPT15906.1 RNA transcription, translation and transport factor protein [Picochlorum sp. SENEW3]
MASELVICRSVRRHLQTLGYHAVPTQKESECRVEDIHRHVFDRLNDTRWIQEVVVWLEDTKIRHYDIDDRRGLKSTDATVWQEAVGKYVKELNCPVPEDSSSDTQPRALSVHAFVWLLGYAVGVAYEDGEDYDDVLTKHVMHAGIQPESYEPKTILDDIDTDEAREALRSVCSILGVKTSGEITVEGLSRCLYRVEHEIVPVLRRKGDMSFSLDDDQKIRQVIPLGFQTGDEQVDLAARVLRILHIKELRRLQNAIDDAIVAHQEVTANPRTETGRGNTKKKKNKMAS